MAHRNDPGEKSNLDVEPDEAPEAILYGADVDEALPDVISDTGVEGGVDALNESEEPNTEY